MAIRLEVPIFGPASATAAVLAGASRLELNAEGSYGAGGLTPLVEELAQLYSLEVPIRVMIRPRGPPITGARDFIYLEAEVEAMELSIQQFKTSGLLSADRGDGFVFGILKEDDKGRPAGDAENSSGKQIILDVDQCKRLAHAAKPFKTVFHRAFDELVGSGNWEATLEELVASEFDGILTSGGPGNAADNVENLNAILEKAGDRIEIILGGGVRSTNVRELTRSLELATKQSAPWVHSSCLTRRETETVDEKEVGGILTELD